MSACYMYTHVIVCNNIRLSFVSNVLSMIYIISLSICFPWKKITAFESFNHLLYYWLNFSSRGIAAKTDFDNHICYFEKYMYFPEFKRKPVVFSTIVLHSPWLSTKRQGTEPCPKLPGLRGFSQLSIPVIEPSQSVRGPFHLSICIWSDDRLSACLPLSNTRGVF